MVELLFLVAGLQAPAPWMRDEVLSEVVAGCDANIASIQHGTASYDVETTSYVTVHQRQGRPELAKAASARKNTTQSHITFKGTNAYWTFDDMRCLRDDERDISFHASNLERDAAGSPIDIDLIAIIYERGAGPRWPELYHPRYLGHGVTGPHDSLTVSDMIRRDYGHPKIRFEVERTEDLVKITTHVPSIHVRAEYLIDTTKGYGVTSLKIWSTKTGDRLASETTADYVKIHEAFVASRIVKVHRVLVDGKYEPRDRIEYNLKTCDLVDVPGDEEFQFEALGLPVGARIWDKRTNKQYVHGYDAVTEEDVRKVLADIQTAQVKNPGAAGSDYWIRTAIILAMILPLFVIVVWWRHIFRRKPTQSGP